MMHARFEPCVQGLGPLPRGDERWRCGAILVVALLLTAAAPTPSRLSNPAQEAHAHALFREIRCVLCQNESIDDSEADIAGDLRTIVRGQVAAGRSDTEIKRFLTDRYGEFVLLKPAFSLGNALLWLAPFAIVLAGLLAFAFGRRNVPAPEAALTPEEAAQVSALAKATVATQSGPTIGAGGEA